jgi:TRAP-type C4-dicarboxylate transport system permease small subunit
MKWLRFLDTIDRGVARVVAALLVIVVALLLTLAFVEVALKLAKRGVPQLALFTRYLVVWVGFLGGAVATYQARNINIDVVTRFMGSGPSRRVVAAIMNGAAVLLVALLLKVALSYVGDIFTADRVALRANFMGLEIGFKEWWFASIVPIGLGVIGWHFLARLAFSIGGYDPGDRSDIRPERPEETAPESLPIPAVEPAALELTANEPGVEEPAGGAQ